VSEQQQIGFSTYKPMVPADYPLGPTAPQIIQEVTSNEPIATPQG
jgi:hypothetical protein